MSQRSSFGRPKRPDRSQVTSDIRDAEKKQKSDLKNSESDTTKNPQAQASDRSPNRKQILQNSNRDNRTSKSRKSDARSDKRSDRDRGGSSKPNRIEVSDPKLFQGETLIKQGHGAGSIEFVNSGYKRELGMISSIIRVFEEKCEACRIQLAQGNYLQFMWFSLSIFQSLV